MITTDLIEYHTAIRLACFSLLLVILLGLERHLPKRPIPKRSRWLINIGLLSIGLFILRLFPSILPVLVAWHMETWRVGILPQLPLPVIVQGMVAILALDFILYWQHVLTHKVPVLWRVHRVHHSDLAMDATTGLRFHPLETVLSMGLKTTAVILLGANALTVLCYEILLNAAALFTHSNLRLPETVEKYLRWLLVTPDMHRIHHSTVCQETDSNYGNFLSCWDRWCNSYRADPGTNHVDMCIGLDYARTPESQTLSAQLALPFCNPVEGHRHR